MSEEGIQLFCGDKFWVIGSLLINVKKIIFAEIYFDQKLRKLIGLVVFNVIYRQANQ